MSLFFFSNKMWVLVSYLPTFSDDVTLLTLSRILQCKIYNSKYILGQWYAENLWWLYSLLTLWVRWRNLTVRWYVFSSSDWNSSDRTKVVTNIKTTFSSNSLLEDGLRKPGSRVYIIQILPDKIDHPKAKLRYVFFTSWYDGSFQSPDDSSLNNHWEEYRI